MSLMTAYIKPDCIHVFADGAFYDTETGILMRVENKICPLPGLNAVFSSRGSSPAFAGFYAAVAAFSFEAFDDLTNALPEVWAVFDALMGDVGCEIMIAGWSESRARGEVYARATHAYSKWGGMSETGATYRWVEGGVSFGVDGRDWPEGDPTEDNCAPMVAAIEKARSIQYDLHCGEQDTENMGYAIGGHIQHVVLGSHVMGTEILKVWPDVIGEPIAPFRVVAEPLAA